MVRDSRNSKLYVTDWLERTFYFVRSARSVINRDNEFILILTFNERRFNSHDDLKDVVELIEALQIYDSTLYVESFYFIYKVTGKAEHRIGHIYTHDVLTFSLGKITFDELITKLDYKEMWKDIDLQSDESNRRKS